MTTTPVAPATGWRSSARLPRDHYVRLDGNDYSVHPLVIGRRIEVIAEGSGIARGTSHAARMRSSTSSASLTRGPRIREINAALNAIEPARARDHRNPGTRPNHVTR